MKTQYKQIDTSTLAGLKAAERLHQNGWTVIRVGLYIIQFMKRGKS